jgi:energy-coupling factor transporter ATP-binding protein EcfA2
MIRFHFQDDLVPNVLKTEGYLACENLILLDENRRSASIVKEIAATFTPDIQNIQAAVVFLQTIWDVVPDKHSMKRYKFALVPTQAEYRVAESHSGEIRMDNYVFVPSNNFIEVRYEQHQHSKYVLNVKGEGIFGSICRAELKHKGVPCPPLDLLYSVQQAVSGLCSFSCLFNVEDVVIAESNVLTTGTAQDFRLTLWNGFNVKECCFSEISCNLSVGVMGLTGSGKSSLVKALRLHLAGEAPIKLEGGDSRFTRDANDCAESFIVNGIRMYETPGLPQNDMQVVNDMQVAFTKLPPSLMVIVARKGVYDCRPTDTHLIGLKTMISRVLALNPQAKLLVVFTKSPPDIWNAATIEHWRAEFELPRVQVVDFLHVNSILEVESPEHEQRGLDELWNKIKETLILSPPPIHNIRTWWEFLVGLSGSYTMKVLGTAIVSVVWVAVTRTPPPPL